MVRVVVIGDIDGNGVVDVLDAIALSGAFGAVPGVANWNPNADFETYEIDVLDAILLSSNYGGTQP